MDRTKNQIIENIIELRANISILRGEGERGREIDNIKCNSELITTYLANAFDTLFLKIKHRDDIIAELRKENAAFKNGEFKEMINTHLDKTKEYLISTIEDIFEEEKK